MKKAGSTGSLLPEHPRLFPGTHVTRTDLELSNFDSSSWERSSSDMLSQVRTGEVKLGWERTN